MVGPSFKAFSAGSSTGGDREILVQHLLVKENDFNLLVELQKRVAEGEDLSDLAVEYSICPSKEEGGVLGWVRRGQMVPEFEEAAFSAPLDTIVRCKTKFGWHLLGEVQPSELHDRLQDPNFTENAQLIDVREPENYLLTVIGHWRWYWLSVGAQPSDPVQQILFRAGLLPPLLMVAMGRKGGPRDMRPVDPMAGCVLGLEKPSSSANSDSVNIDDAEIVDTSTTSLVR